MSLPQDSSSKAASGSNGDNTQSQSLPFPASTNITPGPEVQIPPTNGTSSIEMAVANFRPSSKDVISGIAPHVFDERRRRRRRSSASSQRRTSRPPIRTPSQRSLLTVPSCESSPLRLSVAIATVDGLEIILNSTDIDPRMGKGSNAHLARSPPPPKPVFSDTQPKAPPEVLATPNLAQDKLSLSRRWKTLHILKSFALKLRRRI